MKYKQLTIRTAAKLNVIYLFSLLSIFLSGSISFSQNQLIWTATYNGPLRSPSNDNSSAILQDQTGNIFVAGRVTSQILNYNTYILKYNNTGTTRLWEKKYDNLAFTNLAVDLQNNFYITGYCQNPQTGDRDIFLIKFNQFCDSLWCRIYNGLGNTDDIPCSLNIDNSNNIFITGRSSYKYIALKYNPDGNLIWNAIDNTPNYYDNKPITGAIDSHGNVYVTGMSDSTGNMHYRFFTVMFNSSGIQSWKAIYTSSTSYQDRVTAICVDRNYVYVAGASAQQVGVYEVFDYATIKYNFAGQQLWASRYNGTADSNDYPTSIAVDSSGNVYVSGYSTGLNSLYDAVTVKYNSSGQEQFVKRFNGSGNAEDKIYSMILYNNSSIVLTGSTASSIVNLDFLTLKYDVSGNLTWGKTYNGTGNSTDISSALCTDISGNVIITGQSTGITSGPDYETIKYDVNGNQLWAKRDSVAVFFTSSDRAISLITDNSNNIYALGSCEGQGTGTDYVLIKYNPGGQKIWEKTYNGIQNNNDVPVKMCLDYSGNIVVTGSSVGINNNTDILTIKYNPNGDTLWTKRYNGTADRNDYSNDIFVDTDNCVYIAGYSYFTGSPSYLAYFLTIKYDSDGNQKWVSTYTNNYYADEAFAVIVDKNKNVYSTGHIVASGSGSNICTIKYDSTGNIKWVQIYDDNQMADEGLGIDLDTAGNIIVTGTSSWSGWYTGGAHCKLIKYNPDGNRLNTISFAHYDYISNSSQIVKVDKSNNVIVTAGIQGSPSTSRNLTVYKFNNNFIPVWTRTFASPSNKSSEPGALVLDSLRNVYVTGYSTNDRNTDFVTIKLDSSGNQCWRIGYNGACDSNDAAGCIALDKDNNVIIGGTSYNTLTKNDIVLIKYSQSPSININNESTVINKFELNQNFPNPFNPKTCIEYNLKHNSFVSLKIFNMLGQEIYTLVSKNQKEGKYTIEFDGSSLPSGIYLYRLIAGDFSDTKKMVILK